jgi:hypothetical protein
MSFAANAGRLVTEARQRINKKISERDDEGIFEHAGTVVKGLRASAPAEGWVGGARPVSVWTGKWKGLGTA